MKFHPLIPLLALLMAVTAPVNADADAERPDAVTAGTAGGDQTESVNPADATPAKPPFTTPAVPGRSYRDQAPPAYRIQRNYGGDTSAFPRVPGTGFRNYSQPGYRR